MEETLLKSEIEKVFEAHDVSYTAANIEQITSQGISAKAIETQLNFFKRGIKKSELAEAAVKSNGIKVLKAKEVDDYELFFEQQKGNKKLVKFVPASGAASRMFKFLSEFLRSFDVEKETINLYINKNKDEEFKVFIAGLEKFPFYQPVKNSLFKKYPDFAEWKRNKRVYHFVKKMMESKEFNFINKPKAVLPFHQYGDHSVTPIEEHLKEAALYASTNKESEVHFTISEAHQGYFDAIVDEVKPKIEKEFDIKIEITYSNQKQSTDTLAVDMNNKPFRLEDGSLLFRPGGHGALIENLNSIEADIIFIKNIDNVTNAQLETVVKYKRALAGVLIALQDRIFKYIELIDSGQMDAEKIREVVVFLREDLNICVHEYFDKFKEDFQKEYIRDILDRPIRVCGMVKNEGEPGGGPFWVLNKKGCRSLQIVESSQIDLKDFEQKEIVTSSTHFNPVDLVCGTKNSKGQKFDLTQFIDPNSGFIVQKNHKGRDLKSYELPGLWNGAMANWLTVFVQVPLGTFNPVKTVNDLLKAGHQEGE